MKLRNIGFVAAGAVLLSGLLITAPQSGSAQAQDDDDHPGKPVYEHWCAPCHDSGQGHPGTQGLQIKYAGSDTPAVLLERTDLTPPVVKTFVRQGVLSMAPFRKTEITDDELDALADFLSD